MTSPYLSSPLFGSPWGHTIGRDAEGIPTFGVLPEPYRVGFAGAVGTFLMNQAGTLRHAVPVFAKPGCPIAIIKSGGWD